mgnify:CR=1 FL=1
MEGNAPLPHFDHRVASGDLDILTRVVSMHIAGFGRYRNSRKTLRQNPTRITSIVKLRGFIPGMR